MKNLLRKLIKSFNKYWPFLLITFVILLFFYPVWLKGLVPLPADFIVGTYYPWLDYKWGYSVGVPVKNPITSDVVSVIYPLRLKAIEMIKNGILPLWNRYMFGGYPLFANFQIALLSPTILVYFLLPNTWAWSTQIILQPLLACVFSYLLLREFKLSKIAAAFGSLFYAFSGFSVIWLEWGAHSLVAAFIPLILYLVKRYLQKENNIWGILLSGTLALQIFSGYPQLVLYTLISILLYLVIFPPTLKSVIKVGLFIALGIALSAIQTIPAVELLYYSQRRFETMSVDLVYLPWQNLISFFAPDFFGNHSTYNFWGVGNYTNNAGYSGLIVLILAIIALLNNRTTKIVKYFFYLFLLSLIIALKNPLSELLTQAGFFGGPAASNTRILVLSNLSLAFMAAWGINTLQRKSDSTEFKSLLFPSVVLVILAVVSVFNYKIKSVDSYSIALRNLAFPFFFLLSSASVFVLRKFFNSQKARIITLVALSALAMVELMRFGFKYTPYSKSDLVFPATPVLNYLQEQEGPLRVLSDGNSPVLPMNMWIPYGIESAAGYDAAYPLRWAKYLSVLNSGKPDAGPMSRYGQIDIFTGDLFNLTNTRYVVTGKIDDKKYDPEFFKNIGYQQVFQDKNTTIYENPEKISRAIFINDWLVIKTDQAILEEMVKDNFNPKKIAIIEENPDLVKNTQAKAEIKYLKYADRQNILEVNADGNGLLYTAEAWFPGWKAFIDGNPSQILRANYTFRAVPILRGRHIVEFIYQPESFKIGMWISLFTLILLLGLLFNETTKNNFSFRKKTAKISH